MACEYQNVTRVYQLIYAYHVSSMAAVDLMPIGNLHKSEVRELAEFLQISSKIITKKSSARLWRGQTAERESLAKLHKKALEKNEHQVVITPNGSDCQYMHMMPLFWIIVCQV